MDHSGGFGRLNPRQQGLSRFDGAIYIAKVAV